MKEGRAAARWVMPLTASFALHGVFFCLFSLSAPAAPGAPSAVTRGVTVVLRRVDGFSSSPAAVPAAAAPAEKAAGSEKVVPKNAAVPKKDAPPAAAKAARKAKTNSGAKKAERAPSAPVQPAAKAMTDTASTASEGIASEGGAASEGAAPVHSAARGGVSGENSGTKGVSQQANGGSAAADAGRIFELSDLKVSRRVKPDYPAIARKRREEGTVTLLITLEGANVLSVKVEKSSGFSALDEAAAAAVRRWRFEPDSRSRSRRIQARVPVTFRLKP